jgi:hypothetical protein
VNPRVEMTSMRQQDVNRSSGMCLDTISALFEFVTLLGSMAFLSAAEVVSKRERSGFVERGKAAVAHVWVVRVGVCTIYVKRSGKEWAEPECSSVGRAIDCSV